MIHVISGLNWLSVALAFIAYFFLGALWFTTLFSKAYKVSLGRDNETLPNKIIFIAGPALCCLVITLASAILIAALNIQTFGDALAFSIVVGVGYLFANTVNIAINPNIPKPILYGIISGSYHFLGILLVSVILVAMK